jgi:hypothetical protein
MLKTPQFALFTLRTLMSMLNISGADINVYYKIIKGAEQYGMELRRTIKNGKEIRGS